MVLALAAIPYATFPPCPPCVVLCTTAASCTPARATCACATCSQPVGAVGAWGKAGRGVGAGVWACGEGGCGETVSMRVMLTGGQDRCA